ncbi:MAG: cyclic nucleotide-binding domain-containing protein [Fibrobacter sp.]|nr:cyclic nucleotide-binding domain-containing protein [Fibrobacter sp.]
MLVLKKGEKTSEMYYVEQGELEAFDDNQILKFIPQGSLVGVTSVMDGTPFAYHIRAGRDSVLVKIDQKGLGEILKKTPPWMLSAINSLAKESSHLKQSVSKPIYHNTLESFAKFLALRAENKPLDTAQTIKEYMWQTRSGKDETANALKELIRRRFVVLKPDVSGKPNAQMHLVKPKLFHILVDFLRAERHGITYPPFGLSQRERSCLEFLGLEDSLFTRSREEWLKYLQTATPLADIIIMIRFVELGIFSEVGDSKKLFLETETLDRYLCAIHEERNIRGLS